MDTVRDWKYDFEEWVRAIFNFHRFEQVFDSCERASMCLSQGDVQRNRWAIKAKASRILDQAELGEEEARYATTYW